MVYYTKTLVACHELTEYGKENYSNMLERKADEILFRHQHPIRYMFSKIKELLRLS